MSAGFTPGPWTVGRDGYNISTVYADAGSIASVFGVPMHTRADEIPSLGDQWVEGLANANLIAAAPDGYEAGEEAIEALNAMMDAWFDYHDAHSLTQPVTGAAGNAFNRALAAREKLEAALAKARGEQVPE